MAKTLLEYSDWLKERDLRWPAPPKLEPVSATPKIKPLDGIRAVTWSIYGTLLRITDGQLLFIHPQDLRMEIALEKTIHEFNMWNSMTRRPGKPSVWLEPKYRNAIETAKLTSGNRLGDIPEIDSAEIWNKMLELLQHKDYTYDQSIYGDLRGLSEKVAFFFHSSLQGVEAAPNALMTLQAVSQAGLRQAALADAQCFSLAQLTQALREQDPIDTIQIYLPESLNTLSYEWGIRKPSMALYAQALLRFKELGIEANQILHVGTRVQDDLAAAKKCGMKTALYAADQASLQVTPDDLKNPDTKPDRLLTDLKQLRDILQI